MIGPAIGGLLIGAAGVGGAYLVDALSCLAMVAAVVAMAPQPPHGVAADREPVGRSIREGPRFVFADQALLGSFAIDLAADGERGPVYA